MNTQQRAEQWKKLCDSWSKLVPPSVPSTNDIQIIEHALKEHFKENSDPQKACVLGATAMFRDMLARHQIPTLLFDANEIMIDALGNICKEKKRLERYLIGDWMQTQPEEKFDIVLSDVAINQLPKDLWPPFMGRIQSWLTPGGVFIHRSFVAPYAPSPPLDEWKKKWFGRSLTPAEQSVAWEEEINYFCYDANTQEEHNHWRKQLYEKLDDGSDEAKAYIEQQMKLFDFSEKSWTILPKDDEVRLITEYFTIVGIAYANDHPLADLSPIYTLVSKQ